MQLSEEYDCMISTYFSTSSGVVRKIYSDLETFLRFYFSFSLENNFSLVDLRYSLKFMAKKSFTSSSGKVFK